MIHVPTRRVSPRISVLIFRMRKRSLEEAGSLPGHGWRMEVGLETRARRASPGCRVQEEAARPGLLAWRREAQRIASCDGGFQARTKASLQSRNPGIRLFLSHRLVEVQNDFPGDFSPLSSPCLCCLGASESGHTGQHCSTSTVVNDDAMIP